MNEDKLERIEGSVNDEESHFVVIPVSGHQAYILKMQIFAFIATSGGFCRQNFQFDCKRNEEK